MAEREADIQRAILVEFGARHDLKLWRNNTGFAYGMSLARPYVPPTLPVTHYGVKGSADIFGVRNDGRFVSIEVKGPRGRQTPEQKRWQAMVESMGGLYILARSVEDVRRGLELGTGETMELK